MASVSTREKLLALYDDIEIISKQILENVVSGKSSKSNEADLLNLTALLIVKSKELKKATTLAEEQAAIEVVMNKLREQVDKEDLHIRYFEKQLKEAEQQLAIAQFQANQKLKSIYKANKKPVSSEELIKYAHRISSSEAVCAPLTWQPGDPRRPYPTEIDAKVGLLMRYNDSPVNGHMMPHQSNLSDMHRSNHSATNEPQVAIQNQFAWHPSGDIHIGVLNQGSVPIETRNHKDTEDVEVMSTDSSSSSSSESQ